MLSNVWPRIRCTTDASSSHFALYLYACGGWLRSGAQRLDGSQFSDGAANKKDGEVCRGWLPLPSVLPASAGAALPHIDDPRCLLPKHQPRISNVQRTTCAASESIRTDALIGGQWTRVEYRQWNRINNNNTFYLWVSVMKLCIDDVCVCVNKTFLCVKRVFSDRCGVNEGWSQGRHAYKSNVDVASQLWQQTETCLFVGLISGGTDEDIREWLRSSGIWYLSRLMGDDDAAPCGQMRKSRPLDRLQRSVWTCGRETILKVGMKRSEVQKYQTHVDEVCWRSKWCKNNDRLIL